MKFFSGLVLGVVSSMAVIPAVCPVNEIVIKTGETKHSVCEIAYKEYQPCELENNVTISWDFKNEKSKHFSIERYIDGDINDAFIISNNTINRILIISICTNNEAFTIYFNSRTSIPCH